MTFAEKISRIAQYSFHDSPIESLHFEGGNNIIQIANCVTTYDTETKIRSAYDTKITFKQISDFKLSQIESAEFRIDEFTSGKVRMVENNIARIELVGLLGFSEASFELSFNFQEVEIEEKYLNSAQW